MKPMILNVADTCEYFESVVSRSCDERAVDHVRFRRQVARVCQHDRKTDRQTVEDLTVGSSPRRSNPASIDQSGFNKVYSSPVNSARKRDASHYQVSLSAAMSIRQAYPADRLDTFAYTLVHNESSDRPYDHERHVSGSS